MHNKFKEGEKMITDKIEALKEDHPEVVITEDIMREYVLDGIEELMQNMTMEQLKELANMLEEEGNE